MLRALDVNVTALRERFPPDSSDLFYLSQLADCVLVTGDRRIQTRKLEAIALRQSGISALFMARFWSKLTFWDQAVWLVRHWPDTERFAASTTMGTYAEIQQHGAVRLIDVG